MRLPFAIVATLLNLLLTLVLGLLSVLPPLLAAAVLILAAWKWDRKHADLVFCGVAAAAALRLLHLILVFPINFLRGVFVYHTSLHVSSEYITSSLLHILGYVLAAAVVFVLLYLLGCPAVVGESFDQIKANLRASVEELSGGLKKSAEAVAQKAAPAAAAGAAAAKTAASTYSRTKKTNRGLLKYILLNFITCGIYGYIFVYGMASDMNEVCDGDGKKTGGLLAFILLNLITCNIYGLVWWYKLCNRMAANAPRYGLTFQENGTTYLLWTLIGIFLCGLGPLFAIHFICRNMNALCAAYNQRNGLTA